MIFDTYWKKRYKKEEREKKRAHADLACERWIQEDREQLLDKLSDQNYSQAKAITAYQEELEGLRRLVRLQEKTIKAQQVAQELSGGRMINAELLAQIVKTGAGDLFDKSAAFIFLAMIELLRAAEEDGKESA